MKGFKRAPKEERPGDSQPASRGQAKVSADLLPGVIAAALGVALWFAAVSPAQQLQQQQLSQAWGSSQAASLQQALKQLSADTLAAARNPTLVQALQSGDDAQLRNAENGLRYWNGVVDAQLNLPGQAVPDSSRAAPVN